ncbi:hypothetical protein LWI28_016398 [Acer negundo]|uniref:Uncharacterized protein n=1 Tax=Acer negundo TaxID=4023 RepID=A0AAD5NRL2_ACENE|nr:hypothetical protein LWI28_016398 [Acer negundo]
MPNSFPSNGLNPNFQFYKGEVFANYEPKVTTRSDLCGLVGKGMLELQDMDMISDGGFIDGELRSSYNDSKNVKEWEGEVGLSESKVNIKKLWNLEEETAKVLEKGLAMGFDFNGKKEELKEIMARRKDVNDNRFCDLVRRLVSKFKTRDL